MPRFTPAGIAHLKDLKDLKKIHFAQTWVGPAGANYGDEVIRQLAVLPNLESIEGINYLSAKGMKTLRTFRHLKSLHVGLKGRTWGYYGPTGVSYLAGMDSLEELSITGDALSDTDLPALQRLTQLKNLSLSCSRVTDRGLASIGRLKHLERV